MTKQSTSYPSRIARHAEQGARPAISSLVAVEKSATENKKNKYKNKKPELINNNTKTMIITLHTQTLQTIWKIPELIDSAVITGQDVVCIQEYWFIHEDTLIKEHTFDIWKLITCWAWRNNRNAATVGIGIIMSLKAYNTITIVEKITSRIMTIQFHGNPHTTIISCYSPTIV